VLSDGSLIFVISPPDGEGWHDLGRAPVWENGVFTGLSAGEGLTITDDRELGRFIRLSRPFPGGRLVLRSGDEAPVLAARLLTGTPSGRMLPPLDFRVATTRGTNALLERKGARTALFITRGFADLPKIRDQRRAQLFSLVQPDEELLCEAVVEISARLSSTGETVDTPNEDAVREQARRCVAAGIRAAAVAIIHSWKNSAMEQMVATWLLEEGFDHVTTSSGVSPVIRFLPRLETALADAWLAPIMRDFTDKVSAAMETGEPWMMTSAGGLSAASAYRPKDSLLSGPAGGLVGCAAIARAAGFTKVLTFDMGGTSTDVARIDGPFTFRYEQEVGPARVLAPAMKIETVAAGGGSICRWNLGRLEVGPESAGSDPGPACYGRGGPLTVTDVNLLLGHMRAEGAGIPIDVTSAQTELHKLMEAMEADGVTPPPPVELLEGLRSIAVGKMAEAIRAISFSEGHHPENFTLFAFGGAGPQHACAVAENLGIQTVLVPGDAGLLSAWGLHQARRQEQEARQLLRPLDQVETLEIWNELAADASSALSIPAPSFRWLAELRLAGQDTPIEISAPSPDVNRDFLIERFREAYRRLYGYDPSPSRAVECVTLRVIAEEAEVVLDAETFGGAELTGPHLLQDRFSTCLIPAGWQLRRGSRQTLLLEKTLAANTDSLEDGNPQIRAALFRNRFEGLVTEMGALLRRTAISPNIRERLDYSCALLDAQGRLVVNAPHVPVHLGALGVCVREVTSRIDLGPGDVVVTNHPSAGGSHLPDITLIAAAFDRAGRRIGFVANRAHHAEIGGIAPGSMPAAARTLAEEGVVIPPMKWITAGIPDPSALEHLLRHSPYPSRRPEENLADLEAQAASVAHGIRTLEAFTASHGGDLVRSEMDGILSRSAALMENLLRHHDGRSFRQSSALDDGTAIETTITVEAGRMTVDFTGSGPVHTRNLNATPAIVRSVLLYVLRLWLNEDIPLNEGQLTGTEVILPESFLNPNFPDDPEKCPAVVGGNVETSQRVTDLLLAALGLCANGQGTMNNFLFGNGTFGYYETIAGGSGAGPSFHGRSGRHVHMTNTAITDPEILEHCFPVRLHQFSIRRDSGGKGLHRGGDGVTREVEFLKPMTVSLLTERRRSRPEGMDGGTDGAPGEQIRILPDGTEQPLPGAVTYDAAARERIVIRTPGGGGWGSFH
jgi:5-oxoprolinase (ATP-hydrolysing)